MESQHPAPCPALRWLPTAPPPRSPCLAGILVRYPIWLPNQQPTSHRPPPRTLAHPSQPSNQHSPPSDSATASTSSSFPCPYDLHRSLSCRILPCSFSTIDATLARTHSPQRCWVPRIQTCEQCHPSAIHFGQAFRIPSSERRRHFPFPCFCLGFNGPASPESITVLETNFPATHLAIQFSLPSKQAAVAAPLVSGVLTSLVRPDSSDSLPPSSDSTPAPVIHPLTFLRPRRLEDLVDPLGSKPPSAL